MKRLIGAIALLAIAMGSAPAQEMKQVPVEDGVAKISAENTAIQFVGTHVGEPKPRLGGFQKFSGSVKVADGAISGMALEIDITSIWTQFDGLTKHLMNADFFEASEFGTASFESTAVEEDQLGQTNVVGNLTLHGVTKEVRFPVKATINDEGISFRSEFKLNRALFGMDKMTSGVEKVVSLTFVVGHKTVVVAEGDTNPLVTKEEVEIEKAELANPVSMTLKLPNMT